MKKIRKGTDYELKYRKALEYFEGEDYYKAQVLLEQIIPVFRGGKRTEEIYFKYAYTHFHSKQYILAAHYFKNFATNFPNSIHAEEARFMVAYSHYKLSPSYRLEQTYTNKAIGDFQLFINTYPNSDRVNEANRLIDEMRVKLEQKAFAQADLYFQLNDYKSATHTYKTALKDYPDAKDAERARFMIVRSTFKLAQNSIDLVKVERYKETIEAYDEFVSRHPDSPYSKEVQTIFETSTQRMKKLQ